MRTCTWAPTVFQGTSVVDRNPSPRVLPSGANLVRLTRDLVQRYEQLGINHLLIAQRWWGNGEEIEASSLDCLAMTALFAGCTERMQLISAIHPGFFQPTAIAKWGATIDQLSGGRWAINVTSGWNLQEFSMYGIDPLTHDERYLRSAEFIQVIRGAWQQQEFSYHGRYYQIENLRLEPQPSSPLQVYQGGQSNSAIDMAASHSDWMFLNGGSPERIGNIIQRANAAARDKGRKLRFAMYAAPLCRPTDAEAWQEIDQRLTRVDPELVAKRKSRVQGAHGMWGDDQDPLGQLDTNEGYAARLIGAPDTVLERIEIYRALGVDMLHLDVSDPLFCEAVLPAVHKL